MVMAIKFAITPAVHMVRVSLAALDNTMAQSSRPFPPDPAPIRPLGMNHAGRSGRSNPAGAGRTGCLSESRRAD